MANRVYDNEKWWQEHGFEWLEEINKRRSSQPLYGIQEIVLAEYFSNVPKKSKVLEFGAGFGRHAKYLSKLENIEYYAVDQSPTMLDALKVYTEGTIKEENVVLIEPRQKLPYPDNYFDVVYTVSVLIHINPEHIQEIIDELKRVAKHVIIHFENTYTEESNLQFADHNGCWRHAVQNLYKNVQVYNDITQEQGLYIITLEDDEQYRFSINPVVRERLNVMGTYLGDGLKVLEGEAGWRQEELEKKENLVRALEGEVGWRQEELEKKENLLRFLEGEVGWRQEELEKKEELLRFLEGEVGWRQKELEEKERNKDKLTNKIVELDNVVSELSNEKLILYTQIEATQNELNTIYESNAWKVIQKVKSNKMITCTGKKAIDLYKKIKGIKDRINNDDKVSLSVNSEIGVEPIVEDFKKQIKEISSQKTLAITHKHWLGVKNSTKELYDVVIEIEELNSYSQVVEIGNMIIDKNVEKLVFSGFASGWNTLCSYIKQKQPNIKIIVFWHGNTTHMYEDYSWVRYQEILQLCREGDINKLAFAKKSMCEVYQHMGLSVGLIQNHVEKVALEPVKSHDKKTDIDESIRIGIYSSGGTWNKNAYTQIAAASLFENATVSMVPYNDRMQLFASQLGLKVCGSTGNIKREELLEEMMKNDINFYITFSECAPLVPLESLNCGVICLTSNNHHYFKGHELEKYLIVDSPDDAVAIYKQAIKALENKEHILKLYEEWYKQNKIIALESAKNI